MTLTKEHLIDSISNHLNLSKKESSAGVGKFYINKKNERRGRNLQTGEEMKLRSRRVVTFRCSEKLRKNINGKDR